MLHDEKGNILKFHFISDPANREIAVKTVKIMGPFNSDAWPKDFQWPEDLECPLVIHEVLHVTGLVDGYKVEDCSNLGGALARSRLRNATEQTGSSAPPNRIDLLR